MPAKSKFLLFGIAVASSFFLIITGCRDLKKSTVTNEPFPGLLNDRTLQEFGEKLFFDKKLSDPEGQSCADCHGPEVGWTGPDEQINKTGGVYPGALHTRFGNRKPNSAAYATFSPLFHAFQEEGEVLFAGGNFWDGRATGYVLGNPAADQAQGPFLNPVEQNISDAKVLVEKVSCSEYVSLFRKAGKEIWGYDDICKNEDFNLKFGIIGFAIAAYEHSGEVNQFSSKFDYYLQGKVKLTKMEKKGLDLFEGKGKCSLCHISTSGSPGMPPLFTDFTFDNLGFPRNPENPWYKMDSTFNPKAEMWLDEGLAEFLRTVPQYAMYADENLGKHQVPTLRNVDKRPSPDFVKAYGHNGYFKNLEDVVHFYNIRDVLPRCEKIQNPQPGVNCWPEPEIRENMNTVEMGNLGLNPDEEKAIVEFMKTLSDGYSLK